MYQMLQLVKVSGSELARVLLYWNFSSRERVGLGAKRSGSVKWWLFEKRAKKIYTSTVLGGGG